MSAVSGASHQPPIPIQPMDVETPETEEEDTSTGKKEEPEGPGTAEKVVNAVTSGKVTGVFLGIGAIGVAIFLIMVILPGILHINIESATTSNNSLPVFLAISAIGVVGLIGVVKGTLGRSKLLCKIWDVCRKILPLIVAAFAMWYGVHTLKVLIDQGTYATGPMIWAFTGVAAGCIYAWGIFFHGRKKH